MLNKKSFWSLCLLVVLVTASAVSAQAIQPVTKEVTMTVFIADSTDGKDAVIAVMCETPIGMTGEVSELSVIGTNSKTVHFVEVKGYPGRHVAIMTCPLNVDGKDTIYAVTINSDGKVVSGSISLIPKKIEGKWRMKKTFLEPFVLPTLKK